ncbi:MAG: Spy/CpxP family protein refolding chaperone [Candidatus Polarisedimenticolia bacterium]
MHVKSIPYVHPRVIEMSRGARAFAFSIGAGCGPEPSSRTEDECCGPEVMAVDPESGLGFGAGQFGVKRPLRFLAYKLKLTEPQVTELAAILDELKTERAQAAVDDRRTMTSFAEAVSGEAFDAAKAAEGATMREKSADRLSAAVVKALARIHALLTPEQRERFAYLIRTGTVLL